MTSQQGLALWKSQIPLYQKIITRCCHQILTPLTRFLPPDFEQKINEFKEMLSIKEHQEYQNYIDVIVHYIEGTKNKSIIELADILVQELGGSLKYWQNIIVDVAEQVSYTSDLNVWQVRKIYQEKLYIDSENLSNQRRLCKLTKNYLVALTNLIKAINKFDIKKDSLSRIDELFKKVKSAQQKYVGFSEQIKGFESSHTLDELSNNISQKSKQNALKELYHFKQPIKHEKGLHERNTLLNYKFKFTNKQSVSERVSGPTKNIRQTNKTISGIQLDQFEAVLKNIKNEKTDLNELRQKFNAMHLENKNQRSVNNLTTIWDKDYYFSYIAHPIEMNTFTQFTYPFQRYQWINYEINSDDEFQDLIGQDVQANSQVSSVSELSKNSFVVSDDYFSDDENIERKEIKPKVKNMFSGRWVFGLNNEIETLKIDKSSYIMVAVDSKVKIPIQTTSKNEIQSLLGRIVDGRDKVSIMDAISKEKIKISKAKLNQFLDKKCKTVPSSENPNKMIYKILEDSSESSLNKNQNNEQDYHVQFKEVEQQQQTSLYEPQYFSQASDGVLTRKQKKMQSQKMINQKVENKTRCSSGRRSNGHGKSKNHNST